MKLTFHQWCNALAGAIIILGILAILAQLYPAEARATTLFVSEGVEIITYDCDTGPQVCEQTNREIEEEIPPTPAEVLFLEEDPLETEQEQTNANQSTPVQASGPQRSLPPRIVHVSRQASVRYLRRGRILHPARRHKLAGPNRP